jgi:hypothetical protein
MEAVVQILEAERLAPVMYIPSEMRHSRLEVTIRPVEEATPGSPTPAGINRELMQKFLKAAKSGEAKDRLKKKLAEGAQFDFDAGKLINGTMTEADWQNLYALQKQAWPKASPRVSGFSAETTGERCQINYYALSPEVAIPSTMYFWNIKKMTREGTRERVPMAKMAPQSV